MIDRDLTHLTPLRNHEKMANIKNINKISNAYLLRRFSLFPSSQEVVFSFFLTFALISLFAYSLVINYQSNNFGLSDGFEITIIFEVLSMFWGGYFLKNSLETNFIEKTNKNMNPDNISMEKTITTCLKKSQKILGIPNPNPTSKIDGNLEAFYAGSGIFQWKHDWANVVLSISVLITSIIISTILASDIEIENSKELFEITFILIVSGLVVLSFLYTLGNSALEIYRVLSGFIVANLLINLNKNFIHPRKGKSLKTNHLKVPSRTAHKLLVKDFSFYIGYLLYLNLSYCFPLNYLKMMTAIGRYLAIPSPYPKGLPVHNFLPLGEL